MIGKFSCGMVVVISRIGLPVFSDSDPEVNLQHGR